METNEVKDDLQVTEIEETKDDEGNDTTDWKALALHNQGIAKRLKTKLAKASEKKPEQEPVTNKTDDSKDLSVKAFLRSAGITKKEEVEFALSKAKKWNVDVDELVEDDDFQESLEKFRTKQANIAAAATVEGDKSGSPVKETTEYWVAKGQPPTPADIPDRAKRTKIINEMVKHADTSGKKFYND